MNLAIPEEIELEAVDDAVRFTQSTQRKMELSFRVWSHVCRARGWNMEDKEVSDERLLQFVYLSLHKDCGVCYSLYSFRDDTFLCCSDTLMPTATPTPTAFVIVSNTRFRQW